jgi:hypothetical protein
LQLAKSSHWPIEWDVPVGQVVSNVVPRAETRDASKNWSTISPAFGEISQVDQKVWKVNVRLDAAYQFFQGKPIVSLAKCMIVHILSCILNIMRPIMVEIENRRHHIQSKFHCRSLRYQT